MIHIENKKTYRGEGIHVGRKMQSFPGGVLGNPFRIGRDGTRDQCPFGEQGNTGKDLQEAHGSNQDPSQKGHTSSDVCIVGGIYR